MKSRIKKILGYLFIYGIAMGFLEAIVVVYLRALFYPDGFCFPLKMMSNNIVFAELIREITTIVMLLSISLIAGRNRLQSLAYFLFSFAVWDIFYYVGLKLFLNWPSSLLTWDILFLIPVVWLSPVIAPLICSFTMILLAFILLIMENRIIDFKVKAAEWILLCLGSFLIFISFIYNYTGLLVSNQLVHEFFSSRQGNILEQITVTYIPDHFNWTLFIIGLLCIHLSIILILRRSYQQIKNHSA